MRRCCQSRIMNDHELEKIEKKEIYRTPSSFKFESEWNFSDAYSKLCRQA